MWPFKKKEVPPVLPLETRKDLFTQYLQCPRGHFNLPPVVVCMECGCNKLQPVSARMVRTVDPNRYWTTVKTEYELAEPC